MTVHHLKPVPPAAPKVNEDLVRKLKHHLARAMKGDAIGMAYVVLDEDGRTMTGWSDNTTPDQLKILGGIGMLQHRLAGGLVDNSYAVTEEEEDDAGKDLAADKPV